MNWDDLRIFDAIARGGTLTAAAERLGLNQSTVSRRLATIEATLGARLVDRRAGRTVLTTTGQDLAVRAEAVADEFAQIERQLTGRDRQLTGRLRVTCTDNFANRFLAPHFVRFAHLHPGIDLDIITRYQYVSLARREADVAIRTTIKPPETLVGRRLFRFATGVYGAQELVAELPAEPDPAALTWIGWRSEAFNRLLITGRFPEANIRHRVDSLIDMASMARAGLGVAVLGCYSADPDPALRRVYAEPFLYAPMDTWVLSHPDLLRVARVREFTRFITDAFLAARDLFEGRRPGADS